ncbi:hypothetical protein [Methylocaldum szegediense]|uniref:Uncharacterized protein n=1 Tax=Methylocaldum szegediense TaxID=73780 RepID=A0ABM9HVL9_9GAMM|nr:hypothetical protein [Methylocaldum szegediense]CAI8716668.1 conserved protein of unknown function [Methylocaldum szegediense]
MDIKNNTASYSAYAFAETKRQRELAMVRESDAVGSVITAGKGKLQIGTDKRNAQALPDELEAVLSRLNLSTEMRREIGAPHQTILSARTKQALNAYLAQAELPQFEARNALSQMLGVDEYA